MQTVNVKWHFWLTEKKFALGALTWCMCSVGGWQMLMSYYHDLTFKHSIILLYNTARTS